MHGTCWLHVRIQCAKHDPTTIQVATPDSNPLHQAQPQLQDLKQQSESQARRSHRAALGTVSNVSFMSMPRSPFPHSHSLIPILIVIPCCPFPFPFSPSIFICWVSISLLGRVISSHNASSVRESIGLVVYAFVLHFKKKKNNKHININSIIMYEGCLRKNMNTLRDVQNFVNTHKIVRKKCKSALKTFTTF